MRNTLVQDYLLDEHYIEYSFDDDEITVTVYSEDGHSISSFCSMQEDETEEQAKIRALENLVRYSIHRLIEEG